MNRSNTTQSGYTLVEALIVVAIVGIVSLVTVPNFIQYMRSAKLKSAAREFTSDVREARQRSVSQYRPVKIGFVTGAGANSYQIADGEYDSTAAGGIEWTVIGDPKTFDPTIYFASTNLTDGADSDNLIDIMFLPNGTIHNGTNADGSNKALPTGANVVIKTVDSIPKDSFRVVLGSAGQVRLE